jgi:hypothetical protein
MWLLNSIEIPQDERPEYEKDGEVEPGQSGRENARERDEQDAARREQPDLVAVPVWSNRREHLAALLIGSGDERVQRTSAQVEPVEHHVGRERHGGNGEPQLNQHAPPPRGQGALQTMTAR